MPSQKPHDPYAALRFRDFRTFLTVNFLVFFGSQMVFMTVGWELYERTGSALDLGLVGLSMVLPFLAFGLFTGNLADRFDRRLLVSLATLAYALCLGALAFLSHFHGTSPDFKHWVFGLLFLMGTADAFCVPAKQSLLPQLVPRTAIHNALTWNSSTFQTAAVTGPAVCGFLLKHFLPYPAIYASAMVLEAVFLVTLLSLHLGPRSSRKEPITTRSLAEGLRFVHRTKPILATLTLDLLAVLLGGCMALLPVFVKDILHSDEQALGWLRGAPAVGAICMALLVARKPMARPGKTLLWAVAGFGAATIVFGLSHWLWLSLAMMFIIGALDNISVIVRGTLVQMLTPERLLGRVQSVNYLFINSSNQLGAFYSGVMATLLGPVPAVVLGGFVSMGIVLLVHRAWPQVARLGPLHKARARA